MSDVIPDSPAAVGNALTKKIGPLPGFAWVLIIVAVAYGAYWYKNRGAASGPAAGASDPLLVGDNPGSTGFSSAGPVTAGDGSVQTTLPVGHPATTTNAQWASLVGNGLIASGKYDPATVQNALSKYLNGQALTSAESAIINIAVRDYQLPPEGVLPVKAAPTPVTPAPKPVVAAPKPAAPKPAPAKPAPKPAPKPAAPTYSWYTVRTGDSLSLIAQRYWGNAGLWTRLYADNRAVVGGNPNLIHPGTKLKVAAKP